MRGLMDAVSQREASTEKHKQLVVRIVVFATGATITIPVRVVDDEKTAQRVAKEHDRELQAKIASAHVAVQAGGMEQAIAQGKGAMQMTLVGTLQGVLTGEFAITRVFHGFHTVQDGEPSRIVAPPPGQLS